jgi:Na+-translocating ferredoxin:NAD+ oxidoreductase RNF subunit RnfB
MHSNPRLLSAVWCGGQEDTTNRGTMQTNIPEPPSPGDTTAAAALNVAAIMTSHDVVSDVFQALPVAAAACAACPARTLWP